MPDAKPDPKPAPAAGEPPAPKKSKLWLIVAAIMAVEGIGVFFLAKMFLPGPATVAAAEEGPDAAAHAPDGHEAPKHGGAHSEADPKSSEAEIPLTECKAFNKESGKLIFFHLRVSVLVAASQLERAKQLVQSKQARIDDRVNTVIRSGEPRQFNEPGLETIKRRIKHECDRIFEDETLIREVLVPYMVQSGSGV